jgi:hypothetical protein
VDTTLTGGPPDRDDTQVVDVSDGRRSGRDDTEVIDPTLEGPLVPPPLPWPTTTATRPLPRSQRPRPPRRWPRRLAIAGGVVGGLLVVGAVAGARRSNDQLTSPSSTTTTIETTPATEPETTAPPTTAASPAAGAATHSDNDEHPPPDDVDSLDCRQDGALGAAAEGELTNHTGKSSNYVITVSFSRRSDSVVYAQGAAWLTNIAPGQRATWSAQSFHPDVPDGGAACAITRVERFAA